MGQIINGKQEAQRILDELKIQVGEYKAKQGRSPRLVVVLVGDDPASQIYVNNKVKACAEVGIESEVRRIFASVSQKELIEDVRKINNDQAVQGLLVQLPVPKHLEVNKVLDEISAKKDVDGLHPFNMGCLLRGDEGGLVACTPQGIMHLILSTGIDLKGKEAVVVGRSNIVGKPCAILLLKEHATVTLCHSRTRDLASACRRADVLVAAVGQPRVITADMVKPGAIVIDVGTNRVDGKLVGDVDFAAAKEKASYITPVPGGVGPMTIAMLLRNTLLAAQRQAAKA